MGGLRHSLYEKLLRITCAGIGLYTLGHSIWGIYVHEFDWSGGLWLAALSGFILFFALVRVAHSGYYLRLPWRG